MNEMSGSGNYSFIYRDWSLAKLHANGTLEGVIIECVVTVLSTSVSVGGACTYEKKH